MTKVCAGAPPARSAPRDARFRRAQRLRRSCEVRRVQDGGHRIATKHFVLLGRVRPPLELPVTAAATARLGLAVSRKVGNAVARNRVKRLVREAFRSAGVHLLASDVDVVVIARPGAAAVEAQEGLAELAQGWRRLARKLEPAPAVLG